VGRSFGPPRVTCRRAGGAQVGRSVGRFRLKNSLRCTRQTVGRSDCSDSNLSPRCARPVGRSVGSNPDRSRVLWRPPHSLATVPRSTLIAQSHCTEAVCDARWSIRRLSEHHTVSWDVCAKTSHIQQSLRLLRLHVHTIMLSAGTGPESATRNGIHCTEAVCDARWSIRRLPEHHTVSCEVCDGQDPTRST
jgi:hypothetical protein